MEIEIVPPSAYAQLTPVERVVVDTYLGELESNAAKIGKRVAEFIREGGKAKADERYFARTRNAAFNADRILGRALVQAAINERILELTRSCEIDSFKIVRELAGIAFSNADDFLASDDYGTPRINLNQMTREQKAAIQSVKISQTQWGTNVAVTFHSKLDAIEKLMKYMGMYEADNRQKAGIASQMPLVPESASTEQAADLYASTLRP